MIEGRIKGVLPDKFVQMTCPTCETRSQAHRPGKIHDDTSGSACQLSAALQNKTAGKEIKQSQMSERHTQEQVEILRNSLKIPQKNTSSIFISQFSISL